MSEIKERGRAFWGKVTSGLESGIDQAQSELGKLQQQAAAAPEASKVRIRAKIGETRGRQDAGQEKLRSSLMQQVTDADAQIADLEGAAAGVSGGAREKILHDADQVRAERDQALGKLENSLEGEIVETESEMQALQKEAADATSGAATRIRMRVEWVRARRDAAQQWLQEIRLRQPAGAAVR